MIVSKISKARLRNLKPNDRIIRLIWAQNLTNEDIERLREEVRISLNELHYSIITNFEVNWKEIIVNREINRHLIYASANELQLEALREQIELAFMDPDYPIITPYEVRWHEMKINYNAKRFLITAPYCNSNDIETLREKVEMTLADPDFLFITPFEVNWHESTTSSWESKFPKARIVVDQPKKIESKLKFIVKGIHAH